MSPCLKATSDCVKTYLKVGLHYGNVSHGVRNGILSLDVVHSWSDWLIFQMPIGKSGALASSFQPTCISVINTKYCPMFELIDIVSWGSATVFPETF